MKIFRQTVGFLLLLTLLLFGKQYLFEGSIQIFAANAYTKIEIPGETTITDKVNVLDPSSNDKSASKDIAGVKIISGAVYYIIDTLKLILYAVALIYIIIAALNIITAQGDENKIKSNKDTIVFALFGFIIILLADTAVTQVFYGGSSVVGVDGVVKEIGPGTCLLNPEVCAKKGSAEILGIVKWGKTILAVIAVVEIIISGIRMIMAIGEADAIEKEKKVFIWVGIGLLLLAINEVIINDVLYVTDKSGKPVPNERLEIGTNLDKGINEFVGVIQFILQFVAIMAVVSLIYGGFLMVANFGDDEKVTKAKGIIRDAILGIIIAISSYAIVSTIVMKGG